MNNNLSVLIMIGIIALVTALLRFLPFFIFNEKRPVPNMITYLGTVLPYSIMAMLVVYCIKHVSFSKPVFWLPEMISVVITVLFHLWKRNTLWSIIGGTACYMILIRWM